MLKQNQDINVSHPTVIYQMKVLFTKNQFAIKQILQDQPYDGQQKEEDEQPTEYKFPIQKMLKEQYQTLDLNNMISKDRQIFINFNKMVTEFHQIIKQKQDMFKNEMYNSQNAIISRIYTFPNKIEMLNDIRADLPKVIIRNKQVYEAIFSFLQLHPCYLINWITKSTINRQPREVIAIIKIIFGEREMKNDKRILHILMAIAKRIFIFELQTYDLREILLSRTDSTFAQLFNLIFENQDQNMNYVNSLIKMILNKLYKLVVSHYAQNKKTTSRPQLKNLFDYETVIQDNDRATERIKHLIQFIEQILQKIVKSLDPQFKTNSSGNEFSEEILSLIYTIRQIIYENIKDNEIQEEEINSYILNLIFETMFKKLHELNQEQVKQEYKIKIKQDKKNKLSEDAFSNEQEHRELQKEVFNLNDKRNLVSVFANHLEKYLRKTPINYSNDCVVHFTKFIEDKENNYRTDLAKFIDVSPINFDYLLIKDAFLNSMAFKEPVLPISINDIIQIYNQLVEKIEIIQIQDHDEDPLFVLIEELGGEPIEVKQGEKVFIQEDLLQQKMNLQIKSKILVEYTEITKCKYCNAALFADLVPQNRFRDAINDKKWKCKIGKCRFFNEASVMLCVKCQTQRDKETLPEDMIFDRYFQSITDKNIDLFQKVLIYLPMIDIHQNISQIITYEWQVEEKKKSNIDYDKLSILDSFKKDLESNPHQQLNQKKNNQISFDNPLEEQAYQKEVQDEYLRERYKKIEQIYKEKINHDRKLKEYTKLVLDIRDKIQTFTQKSQQYIDELKLISENAFTGAGSEFLKQEKQDILSGKLHLKGGQKQQKQGQSMNKSIMKKNTQLEKFFTSLENQQSQLNPAQISIQNIQEIQQNREIYKNNFGFYGKYPLYQLKQRKVLKNIEIHGKKLQAIMKKCQYVFFDDMDNGFKVDLIYEEINRNCFVFGQQTHEAILETFKISKDALAEMRRTCSTKATIQFGNGEFNVFEFVILLNEIKSKIYVYGIKSSDDDVRKKILGTNKRVPPSKEQVIQEKKNKKTILKKQDDSNIITT